MSPGFRSPPRGKPRGTKATPYGFRSPLEGTVETDNAGVAGRLGMMGASSPSTAAKAVLPNKINRIVTGNKTKLFNRIFYLLFAGFNELIWHSCFVITDDLPGRGSIPACGKLFVVTVSVPCNFL